MVEISSLTYTLLVISWITAKRQLIHERTASRNQWNDSYDFIVVGAGSAGCVVANRLAKSGKASVLLIEAGGPQNAIFNDIPALFAAITPQRPDLQWMYYSEPQKNAGLQYPEGRMSESKGKTIGGSSAHNVMMFNRGNKRGYDEWNNTYGAIDWDFEGVLPFFKKFENNTDSNIVSMNPGYHGTKGPVQITTPRQLGKGLLKLKKALNSLGFKDTDINGPKQRGVMLIQSFIDLNGFRVSSGTAYVDPNPYPKNLHIVTKALVYRILFNGFTAVGVEFARNDSPFKVYANKEVIISAGPINSPQLLMLSGVGPRKHLMSFDIPVLIDLPVGYNYKNHLWINAYNPSPPQITIKRLRRLYFKKSGQLSQFPVLVNYFNTGNYSKEWPNIMCHSITNPINSTQILFYCDLMRVQSKGRIRLQSKSPYIPPLIETNFLSDPQDFEDAVKATKFLFKVLELPTIAPIAYVPTFKSVGCPKCPGIKQSKCEKGIRCFIKRSTQTFWHSSGGCRMGSVHRSDVVVDPLLKVKHSRNLRVCDSSIFPDIPNANTNAPSLMVGEKCAHIIREIHHL